MGQVARSPNVTISVEAVEQILDVAVLDGAIERRPDGKVTRAPMPHLVPYSEPKVTNAITASSCYYRFTCSLVYNNQFRVGVLLRQARLIPKRGTELAASQQLHPLIRTVTRGETNTANPVSTLGYAFLFFV
ncbi:unnamed protein product [Heligmosomoides polygyrus]|uniref:Transcriptional regulator n=1 Tax=Heligmosomoides polygyrus TaxID=6339 RepID=A0A183G8R4_HELPZ|nr:unnamed protein product [Heligmosomoides polygyrus]